MVARFSQFISQVLPLTVGNGKPIYRQPFMSAPNPSEALSNLVNNTQQVYNVNPYIGDPTHVLDAQG